MLNVITIQDVFLSQVYLSVKEFIRKKGWLHHNSNDCFNHASDRRTA